MGKRRSRKRRSRTRRQETLLWGWTFLGGVVAGVGFFLLAQARLVEHVQGRMRGEVSAVARFLGRVTFRWRKPNEKIFLALDEVPPEILRITEAVSLALIALGLLGIAVAFPLLLRSRWKRA